MDAPGRQRHLEAIHGRQRFRDAASRARGSDFRPSDSGIRFPSQRLPGVFGSRQRSMEKRFRLRPAAFPLLRNSEFQPDRSRAAKRWP